MHDLGTNQTQRSHLIPHNESLIKLGYMETTGRAHNELPGSQETVSRCSLDPH
jgi:hypothetical protein